MGFFKRKDPADQAQSSKRAAVPSEVQAAELRGRARRRLAGAIALVLAAVIILPMVLDSQPTPVDDNIPIRVPERNTPFQPQVSEPQVATPQTPAPGGAAPTDPSAIPTPPPVTSVQPPVTATPTTPPA
ncbi:MAG: SPOR domain-containing protein, partial [Achromobacter sp.]